MIEVKNKNNFNSEKIKSEDELKEIVDNLKKSGKRIGFGVGGYDLLHPGHMIHLKSAKKLCDVLIIGVTSDNFVEQRKGTGRPVYPDFLRSFSVSQLDCVDYVLISNYKTAVELIKKLKPNIYIKGSDYINKDDSGIQVEEKAVKEVGGEIKFTDDEKLSTTDIIKYIKWNIN